MEKILVIENDVDLCNNLNRFFSKNDFEVTTAYSGSKGLQLFDSENPDLVISDFQLGDLEGSDVLTHVKEINGDIPVVFLSAQNNVKTAIRSIKQGAYDYLTKPICATEMLTVIKDALATIRKGKGKQEKMNFAPPAPSSNSDYLVLRNGASKELYDQIDLVAPTNYSVIVYGESGSGKEAVAKMIHDNSPRRNKPFIAMDCGAITKELAGSEMFGHQKGAFTGALADRMGDFEMANGGTLFLDEVGNLNYDVQTSLLRVVQERKFKRIGSTKEITLDIRIIIASNEDLKQAYQQGKFREDLYHRFNEFSITVPPLRERREELLQFADFFLQQANVELSKKLEGFEEEVIEKFLNYPWHGNLRELKNVVKRAALLSSKNKITRKSLPDDLQQGEKVNSVSHEASVSGKATNFKTAVHEVEKQMIDNALKNCHYNISKTAKILKIDRKTLYNKLKVVNFSPVHA